MPVNLHLHTPLCRHAGGEPHEYAARALTAGLREIAFTDHAPMPVEFPDHTWRMAASDLPGYVRAVLDLRERFAGRITIRLGLEADFVPGTEHFVRRMLDSAPFDLAIGSVHYLGSWNFDHERHAAEFGRRDLTQTWEEYFATIEAMCRTRLFHVAGHFDLIKKWGHRPPRPPRAAIERALVAIRDAGMALEINSSGLRRPCRELYPAPEIAALARDLGIPFTISSDAHHPNEVDAGLDAARALLRDLGVGQVVSFDQGRKVPIPL